MSFINVELSIQLLNIIIGLLKLPNYENNSVIYVQWHLELVENCIGKSLEL